MRRVDDASCEVHAGEAGVGEQEIVGALRERCAGSVTTSAPFSGRLPSIETRLWESRLSMCLRSMLPPYWYLPGSTIQFTVSALNVREPPSGCPWTRSCGTEADREERLLVEVLLRLSPTAAGEEIAAVVDLQEIGGRFAVGASGGDVVGER